MKTLRVKVFIELVVECFDEADAVEYVEAALDNGEIQEAIEEAAPHTVSVKSALLSKTQVLR